MKRMTAMA